MKGSRSGSRRRRASRESGFQARKRGIVRPEALKTAYRGPNEREKRMITAEFKDGRKVTYTRAVYGLLITDPDVIAIMDNETGEILFTGPNKESDAAERKER